MQVDYQLTEEDLIAFSKFQADHPSRFWGGPRMAEYTGNGIRRGSISAATREERGPCDGWGSSGLVQT